MTRGKREFSMTPKQENIYRNLWNQVEKHMSFKNRQQAARGLERYREGVRAFCKHLAVQYQLKNMNNIANKHVKSFIEESKRAGISTRTIKNDLSAIRKLHSRLDNAKNKISDNKKLEFTDKRTIKGIDRAWRDREVKSAVQLAQHMGRQDVAWSLQIGRYMGLRIEEVTALTKTQLRNALQNGYLALTNTKGGIPRDVPVTAQVRPVFEDILRHADRDREKIFIGHGRAHHQVFKSIQNWLNNHRDKFQERYTTDQHYQNQMKIDVERKSLSFHGLRHAYAREQLTLKMEAGMNEKEARLEVAEQLGHGRDSVTLIYLGR
jgi:integrase/recombinase XerD